MRPWILGGAAALALVVPVTARAQAEPASVKELDALAHWLAAKSVPAKCTERCFVLSKLRLGGSVDTGLTFELEGTTLAEGPVTVPLFGPPGKVRVEAVTDAGKPAAVGFEGDHYFAVVKGGDAGRFTVKGSLFLDGELALSIPGPLNALEATLTSGRVVEGEKRSGLVGATVHFDSGDAKAVPSEPPVFQLSRAIRVQRETSFEYRLVLRSAADLGVVRLPLTLGEKVLEVTGVSGWKVEGTELVLPTAGKSATISITGTLADAQKTLNLDGRSPYEWWLVEADAEHRVTAKQDAGAASQLDAAESPIPRTQPTARLFLAKKGQHLELSVQTLSVAEALGAVVRDHHRTLVFTARGDVVGDELFAYENNGLDHLAVVPSGTPIFQATDGIGERIMRRDASVAEIMLPLRKGVHTGRIQTVSESRFGLFGGKLEVGPSAIPLTASRATVRVGLPAGVHPLVALGGDRAIWMMGYGGLVAAAAAAAVAFIALRRTRDRVLATVGLGGLYVVSEGAFVVLTGAIILGLVAVFLARTLTGAKRTQALVGLSAAAGFTALVAMAASMSRMEAPSSPAFVDARPSSTLEAGQTKNDEKAKEESKLAGDGKAVVGGKDGGETGNYAANRHLTGIVQGVQPVALPLPTAVRWITVSRELVPQDRPLAVRIYYVTTAALAPLAGLWLGALFLLAFFHRARWTALISDLRARLAAATRPAPAEPPVTPAE